jgi:16S rRNA (adenine1518-N6/adenine1519-N6)-dimethyltransferase
MTLYEEVRAALRESEFRPRKKLGQNFLIHERVIDSILALLDRDDNAQIVEIGPGLGFLTRRLLERAGKVWAVEVDPVLVERLRRSDFAANPNFQLIHGDILEVALPEMLPETKLQLVGNLPYSISTPVLFRVLEWYKQFSKLVLMVQKEVADRIAGKRGTKDYGILSVWCQIHGRIAEKVNVSREAFFPRPEVRSTVLQIEVFPEPLIAADELPLLRDLLRAAFGQRRKTLGNALASGLKLEREAVETYLRSCEIDPKRRGETLSIEEFIKLTRAARTLRRDLVTDK